MPKRINCNSCSNPSPISQIENNVCLACRAVDEYLAAENANLSNKKPKLTAEEPIFAPNTSQYDAFTQYANYDHDNITFDNIQLTRQEEQLKNHTCKECGKSFKEKYNLNAHIKQKHKSLSFKCDICVRYFAYQCQLNRHHELIHMGLKKFQCSICYNFFGSNRYLTTHTNIIHHKQKYSCEKCGGKFSGMQYFKKHKKLCSIEDRTDNPNQCDICCIVFNRLIDCKNHQKVHE
jgi:Zinc finger, C2H2 type